MIFASRIMRSTGKSTGTYQMRGLIEIEPGLVLAQMDRALPVLGELIARELAGQVADPETVAMILVRLAVCHYLVPGRDENQLLNQLRAAAGLGGQPWGGSTARSC